jgi:hypothetical protein
LRFRLLSQALLDNPLQTSIRCQFLLPLDRILRPGWPIW